MKILRVRAHDFGKLNGELDLAPGLTVIHGENEAGKSTWLQAIFAALCGRRRGRGANTSEEREFERQYEPWNGRPWRATVKFQLDDNRRIEIQQTDLKTKESSAHDDDTGRSVGDEIIYRGSIDGSRFLGLNRQVVPSTLVIAQGDIQRLRQKKGDEASALREELQRAAASAGGAATAVEALRILTEYASREIGLERRNSTKPLQAAIERAARAGESVEAGRRRHVERSKLENRLTDARKSAGYAAALVQCCERIRAQRELDRLDARLAQIDRLAPMFPDDEPPPAPGEGPAAAVERELREAVAAYRTRPDAPGEIAGRGAEEMARELATPPEAPSGDRQAAPEVALAARTWRAATEARALREQLGPGEPPQAVISKEDEPVARRALATLDMPALGSLEEAEQRVEELGNEQARLRIRLEGGPGLLKWAWPGAIVGSALGLLSIVDLLPRLVGAGGFLLTIVCYVFINRTQRRHRRRGPNDRAQELVFELADARANLRDLGRKHKQRDGQLQAANRDLASLGLEADADAVRGALAALKDRETWDRERATWERRVADARKAEADADGALRIALGRRGVEDSQAATGDLLDQYEQQCRQNAALAAGTTHRAALRQAGQIVATDRKRRVAAEERFLAALEAAGFPDDSSEDPEHWAARWLEQREQRTGRLRTAWSRLQHLLDGNTREHLAADREAIAARLSGADGAARDRAEEADELEALTDTELERDLAAARTAAADASIEVGNIEGQLTSEAELPSLAELEEERAAAEREVELLRRAHHILEVAREHLKEAQDEVHRILAPDLREALAGRLELVTGGRYKAVRIDPERGLEVQLEVEDGVHRSASELSHGTVDQVYLLLRIGLAEALGNKKESAPLFLDDATVHIDTDRTVRFLDLLLALSAERQIVVFSQEEEVRAWAERRLGGDPRHRLIELDGHGLPSPQGAGPAAATAASGDEPEPDPTRQHSLL